MQVLKRYRNVAIIGVAIVLTLVALVIVTGPAPAKTPASSLPSANPTSAALANRAAVPGRVLSSDEQIALYQDKLRQSEDSPNYSRLGLAYLQKAREVGDPTYYAKAEGVFKKSLDFDRTNVEAMGGMGSLALSRHKFAEALDWGQKAQKLKPGYAYNYGVIADAQIELGRYDDAAQTLQQMVDLHPDISSFSRISYLRELRGQYESAEDAMKKAIVAGGPAVENVAWVTYQLGNLYYTHNDYKQAEAAYRNALQMLPNYVYAQAGLARVMAARQDFNGAIQLYASVVQRFPLPEFIIELGDMYGASGQPAEANRQYELVRSIQKIYAANGVDTDLEMALFDADHKNNLPAALEQAKKEYANRPSVKAADTVAWTLYQSGDYKAAGEYSQKALQLGTQDALFFFHSGMIAYKQGQTNEARTYLNKALSLNPNFSFLHSATAKQTLAELGDASTTK